MILTIILLCTLLTLVVVTLIATVLGLGGFIIIFGDVIVFILVLAWILKKIFKRRK